MDKIIIGEKMVKKIIPKEIMSLVSPLVKKQATLCVMMLQLETLTIQIQALKKQIVDEMNNKGGA